MSGLYTTVTIPEAAGTGGEKFDLLEILEDQRNLFRVTIRNLTDDQARVRSTVSELSLGGLLKHLAWGEINTAKILTERDENAELDMAMLADNYELLDHETVAQWLARYDEAAAEVDRIVVGIDDLDTLIPQPTAPWAPDRTYASVRRMIVHKIRETAHHCGHADIIREALDGQSTMAAISEGQEWAEGTEWEQPTG